MYTHAARCDCYSSDANITCQCTQFTNTRSTHTCIYIYKHVSKHLSDCYTTAANSNTHDDETLHQTTTHCNTSKCDWYSTVANSSTHT